MDWNQILPNLLVGSHPEGIKDIELLRKHCGITAVLNLQTDEDLKERNLDWSLFEATYKELGIRVERVPMRDFDRSDQAEKLPRAVRILASLLDAGHKVYLHCNAGMGRSPLTAMAYLCWIRNIEPGDAISYVKMRRSCAPYEDLIEQTEAVTDNVYE